jgi:hypothetical protein
MYIYISQVAFSMINQYSVDTFRLAHVRRMSFSYHIIFILFTHIKNKSRPTNKEHTLSRSSRCAFYGDQPRRYDLKLRRFRYPSFRHQSMTMETEEVPKHCSIFRQHQKIPPHPLPVRIPGFSREEVSCVPRYFISLGSNLSPRHFPFKRPQLVFLLQTHTPIILVTPPEFRQIPFRLRSMSASRQPPRSPRLGYYFRKIKRIKL